MIDTYKGESVGKKLARLAFWRAAIAEAEGGDGYYKPIDLNTSTIVVLASRVGGDLSVLSGFGVPFDRIVAVDRCESAVDECRQRWPSANVALGEVVDHVTSATDIVFVDFTGPLCRGTLDTCLACLRPMRLGTLFGVALLKGREKDAALDSLRISSNRRGRRLMASLSRNLRPGDREAVAAHALSGQCSARDLVGRLAQGDPSDRFAALSIARTDLAPLGIWEYQSTTPDGRGSPMTIGLFRLGSRPFEGWGRGRTIGAKLRLNSPLRYGARLPSDTASLRSEAVAIVHAFEAMGRRDGVARASRMLMIPSSTVAAWKAHATRGTYEATT